MAVNERLFPELARSGYRLTSPPDATYNCIAWAAGRTNVWWWPDSEGFDFWPAHLPREATLANFLEAFRLLGYEGCQEEHLEPSWEKVAIYAVAGEPSHATRQLPSGRWTSKLGPDDDIEHELHSLAGPTYGVVVQVLKRPVSS